ncbi:DUF1214 domain-containing protein [Parabacteroides sp. OttesenSCG-928-O15]|nr:DUF1214 domain-containing protein [Parabacteroides sp. OttesenSCG-928-O15]
MKKIYLSLMLLAGLLSACDKSESDPDINKLSSEEIRQLTAEAYIMSYPLVMNYASLYRQVANPQSSEYTGGFGELRHYGFYTPDNKDIVSPNNDTPYTWGWVDLRSEPWVLVMPEADGNRYYTSQCDDMWGFVLDSPGSVIDGQQGGAYLLATTEWNDALPTGIKRAILGESYFIGILTRTGAEGPEDLENVQKIQAGYQLMPLHAYQGKAAPKEAAPIDWIPFVAGEENSIEAFRYVNFMLQYILPNELDKAALDNMAKLGIKAGMPWDTSKFTKEAKEAMTAGIADAIHTLNTTQARSGDLFNTREALKTNYIFRALGVQVGIFGNYATQAVYLSINKDADGNPVNTATSSYRLTFRPEQIPPAEYFWSITMYSLPNRLLVANPIDRYSIGSRSQQLQTNPDGSIDVYISKDSPGAALESNWLPAPDGEPFIIMRVYGPGESVLNGTYQLPPLTVYQK